MCGPHFCSMKITEDVRKYVAKDGISEAQTVGIRNAGQGGANRPRESEIYSKAH